MKNILKNILKWLVCVFLTITVIYTVSQLYVISEGIYLYIHGEEIIEETLEGEDVFRVINREEEFAKYTFNHETQNEKVRELYSKYPAGVALFYVRIWYALSCGELAIMSVSLGIIIGTGIYMLFDKEKKILKTVIVMYIFSILILGFVQGFTNIYMSNGATLTLLERWVYPDEYIVPVTVIFALVIIVRVIRQKEIARKLNEKLKEIKEKSE